MNTDEFEKIWNSLKKCGFDAYALKGKEKLFIDPSRIYMMVDSRPYTIDEKFLEMDKTINSSTHLKEPQVPIEKYTGTLTTYTQNLKFQGDKILFGLVDGVILAAAITTENYKKIEGVRIFGNNGKENISTVVDNKIFKTILIFLNQNTAKDERMTVLFGDDYPLLIKISYFRIYIAPQMYDYSDKQPYIDLIRENIQTKNKINMNIFEDEE